ncbi:MAG: LytR C-terminal domain-containing protein, partial [Actinomycetota bacterium]|nr:LytR C-terminal domain-containing protein [Actinomycetota bacterium]
IRRVLSKASRAGRNPATLNSLVGTAVDNVTIDKSFSTKDIFRLVRRFKSLEPAAVEMLSLPTTEARVRGQSMQRLQQPEADQILARFTGRSPAVPAGGKPARPSILPNTVRVRVLNGSGIDGQASDVARALQGAQFNVAGTGPADSYRYTRSVVRYGQGQLAKAQLLEGYLGGGAQLTEDRTLRGVDLVLVSGSSFTGVRAPSEAGATTTSAPPATSGAAAPAPAPAKTGPPQPEC